MTLTTKGAPLPFAETAPHPVRDLQPQRELQALVLDRAHRAHRLRVAQRLPARGEEVDLARVVRALGELLPPGSEIALGHGGLGQGRLEA